MEDVQPDAGSTSQQSNTLGGSERTKTQLSMPTGDESFDASILTTLQLSPSKGSPPAADKEIMDIPQQPMSPPTSPDMATAEDDAGSNTLGGSKRTKTRPQPILSQDGPNATSTDNTPVHPPEQSNNSGSITMLKPHSSGLSEPDIDSLLKHIREYDGFKKESKPQHDRVAEAIMAVQDASQSDDWSNLLRGVIILTISLGFLSGKVSNTHT